MWKEDDSSSGDNDEANSFQTFSQTYGLLNRFLPDGCLPRVYIYTLNIIPIYDSAKTRLDSNGMHPGVPIALAVLIICQTYTSPSSGKTCKSTRSNLRDVRLLVSISWVVAKKKFLISIV